MLVIDMSFWICMLACNMVLYDGKLYGYVGMPYRHTKVTWCVATNAICVI
jgi:hypothetical protein